jgi:hypothetical protein
MMGRHESESYWLLFLFVVPLVLLFVCPTAGAQVPCGTAIPTNVGTPAQIIPTNYTSFYDPGPNYNTVTLAPGPPGYQDTAFSATNPCTVIRVTQGDSGTGNDPTQTPPVEHIHSYKYTPINCTDDLELIGSPSVPSWELWNIPASTLFQVPSASNLQHNNDANPVWEHCTHGNNAVSGRTLYWHSVGGASNTPFHTGPQLHRYRVDTQTDTLLHDFSTAGNTMCGAGPCTGICFGCSSNGPHQGIVSLDDVVAITGASAGGTWYVFEWDLYNNVQVGTFTSVAATVTYPLAAAYPDHRVIVQNTTDAGDLYDATGTFILTTPQAVFKIHNEEGLDSSGHDVVYAGGLQGAGQSPCLHGPGIVKYTLDPPLTVTCMADSGWEDLHVSVSQDGKWLASESYQSFQNVADGCTNHYYNVTNPGLNWQQFFTWNAGSSPSYMPSEMRIVATDGSTTYRMVHHRDRAKDNATCGGGLGLGGNYDYWATPKTAISYDGKYIAFTSNFGVGIQTASNISYTDEYILLTGLAGSTAGIPAPPTNLAVTVQ